MSDNSNYVQCLICGEFLQYLNTKHLKTHGSTCADYMEEFPGAPLQSEEMIRDHMLAMKDYTIPQELIEQRRIGQLKWWTTEEGIAKKKEMSEHPIALRGSN